MENVISLFIISYHSSHHTRIYVLEMRFGIMLTSYLNKRIQHEKIDLQFSSRVNKNSKRPELEPLLRMLGVVAEFESAIINER